MTIKAYYNEIDPFAAAWLRELIKAGHIANGVVDETGVNMHDQQHRRIIMKASKTLSNKERESIISAVRGKAQEKWNSSPLADEMAELAVEAQSIVHKAQVVIVPEKDRKVLNRYGAQPYTNSINFLINEKSGKPIRSWNSSPKTVGIRLYSYEGFSTPTGYPTDHQSFLNIIHAANPALLPRYAELWFLQDCEIEAAGNAFSRLLSNCNTTKQVYENEALRPFMPEGMLNLEKAPKKRSIVSETDAALIAELSSVE